MDLSEAASFLGAVLLGMILLLAIQIAVIIWFTGVPTSFPKPIHMSHTTLPEKLVDGTGEFLAADGNANKAEVALSTMLQFLFQQLARDARILNWLRSRLTAEFAELLDRSSLGRLFESLTLQYINVGTEFPDISKIKVLSGELEPGKQRLKSLELQLDIVYHGSFRLDLDAVMLLGKVANISITVKKIKGTLRMSFQRMPYTHWSLAFVKTPILELQVDGRFLGRQLKPRLIHLIIAQIKRAVARKHTLPNYKIRYKPFFPKVDPGQMDIPDNIHVDMTGCLSVRIVELTRIFSKIPQCNVYCTISVDSHAWVSMRHRDAMSLVTLDVVITKLDAKILGVVFKQVMLMSGSGNMKLFNGVVVETVVPLSAAYRADLRRGDVVIAVDNKRVTNTNQLEKFIKNISQHSFTMRIEREVRRCSRDVKKLDVLSTDGADLKPVKISKSNSFSFRRVSEVMESVRLQTCKSGQNKTENQDPQNNQLSPDQTDHDALQIPRDANSNVKSVDSAQFPNIGLRKRRCSVENRASSDSSTGSTPSTSGPSSPFRLTKEVKAKGPKESTLLAGVQGKLAAEKKIEINTSEGNRDQHDSVEILQTHSTKPFVLSSVVCLDEEFEFKLNKNHKYLNLNIWSKGNEGEEESLLGYINIPLKSIIFECRKSPIGHYIKEYQLLPPDVNITFSKSHELASHPGFEPCLCFGDVLFSYFWKAKEGAPNTPPSMPEPAAREESTTSRKSTGDDERKHDFIRTHFHRSLHCDFCNKRIWLKDAMQCRSCTMCCHKKCVAKCQDGSPCNASCHDNFSPVQILVGDAEQAELAVDGQEDDATDVHIDTLYDTDDDERNSVSRSEEQSSGSMRRAGSAQSLAAPRLSMGGLRSLPPSPCHTPRKQSLASEEVFASVRAAWVSGAGVEAMLAPLLRCRLPPDALLDAARHTGRTLYLDLPPTHHILLDINNMISRVRECLMEEQTGDGEGVRSRALTALMLHCCAVLQSIAQPPTTEEPQH